MNHGFIRVAVANPQIRVADPQFNAQEIVKLALRAADEGVEVLVFGELSITGYTCGDLFFQKSLIEGAQEALGVIAEKTSGTNMLLCVGLPVCHEDKLYNVCALVKSGKVLGLVPKVNLGQSEQRYFTKAERYHIIKIGDELYPMTQMLCVANDNVTLEVEIGDSLYAPVQSSSDCAALITLNTAASCETVGEADRRRTLIKAQSLKTCSAYVYANAGRGESTTDLAFSGHGIIAENGVILAENKPFEDNQLTVADIDTELLTYGRTSNTGIKPCDGERTATSFSLPEQSGKIIRRVEKLPFVPQCEDEAELILNIQAQGLSKRIQACGAKKLVLGVSGGLDSALALLVCQRVIRQLKMPSKSLVAVSMPCFGTSEQTAANALTLAKECKADYRIINICDSVTRHLKDIGHSLDTRDAAYENAQARMRTMVLMDIANSESGLVVGTGDLSEAALGWCTYNGDHMSMYGVNASVPKTLVKYLVAYEAKRYGGVMEKALSGVLNTEISPELLPTESGRIAQKTEDIIGKFELNDFFLYYAVKCGCTPIKTLIYTAAAFGGKPSDYAQSLKNFYKRFFASQFKRSCSPDGAAIGFSLSPRGGLNMPSDAVADLWIKESDKIGKSGV